MTVSDLRPYLRQHCINYDCKKFYSKGPRYISSLLDSMFRRAENANYGAIGFLAENVSLPCGFHWVVPKGTDCFLQ
jgi:hypothetical protein